MANPNDREQIQRKHEWRKSTLVLALLFGFGIALITIGALLDRGLTHDVIISIGSVFVGSATSTFIGRIFAPSPLETVTHVLNELISMPWRASDEELRPFRRKLHGYLRTQHASGKAWLYREFDFGATEIPGYLCASVQYTNIKKSAVKYRYYGFSVKNRLVLVGINANKPNEPSVIQVFPGGSGQSNIYSGLAFLEAGTRDELVVPTILSEDALVTDAQPGPLKAEQGLQLEKYWSTEFLSGVDLPPSTPPQPEKEKPAAPPVQATA